MVILEGTILRVHGTHFTYAVCPGGKIDLVPGVTAPTNVILNPGDYVSTEAGSFAVKDGRLWHMVE